VDIRPRLALTPSHADPIAHCRKLIRLLRHMEKSAAALAEDFATRRVHRVKIPPQLAYHACRLQPRRGVRGKCEFEGGLPAQIG
jgi:hypothetical protein